MKNNSTKIIKTIFDKYSVIILGVTAVFISVNTEIEIVEPIVILLVIFASNKYEKKGIIYTTIFAIFILGIQDLYSLQVDLIEFIFEVFIILIATVYIFRSKKSIEKINIKLKERVKELECLYNISKISEKNKTNIANLLIDTVSEIPKGYQYPEDTCAEIDYEGKKYKSDDFKKSKWSQKSEILIDNKVKGYIEVYYNNEHPKEFKNSPFLKEEHDLIEQLAKRISNIIKIIEQEMNIREQRNFLAITLNSIGDGVIVTDRYGNVESLNQEAERLTKWNSEEAQGKKLSEVFNIINSKTRKTIDNPVNKVLAEGIVVGLANHTKLISKDGTEYHIGDSAAPIKDDTGNIYGVVLVFRNVTKEYKLRSEIKNRADIFSKAIEEAPFPIMVHNDKGEVVEVNEVWEEITGYKKEEIPTIEDWTEKAYGKNRDEVIEHIRRIYSIKDKIDSGEFTIKTKYNSLRRWDFKSSHIGIDENGSNLYISMAIDVTERNMMVKKLKMLNRIYKSLSSINQVIIKENSIEDLIESAAKNVIEVGGYKTVWIAKIENENKLNVLSVQGRDCAYIRNKMSIDLDFNHEKLNVFEKTIKYDKEVIINKDNEFQLLDQYCKSVGVFPLRVFEKLWGIAVFCSNQENCFNDQEVKLLKELNGDISLGIEKIVSNKKRLESEREYREIFDKSPVGIFKTTSSGKLKLINPAMAKILEFENIKEVYNHYKDLGRDLYVNPDKRKKFINLLKNEGEARNFIYQAYDKFGNIKWIEMNARINSKNYLDDFVIEGFAVDITERKKHEDRIAYMTFHDKLTGLYNRTYIEDMIKRIDTNRNLPISLIMIDLNNLKLINDSLGHDTGDECIKATADIIKKSTRKEDVAARWGGDEFVILLPNTNHKESEIIIERMNEYQKENNSEMTISMAVGTATKTIAEENINETLSYSEDRMYINKIANKKSDRSMVISGLLNTLKEKSHETEAHVNRMTEMSMLFGKILNLDKKDMDKLALLSLLHDIGKISIPEDILNKTGKLTAQEWELIKTHPEVGYRIIENIPRFSHIAEEILHHHEKWDGTGYPEQLKGQEIPLLSRVLSIVDAYDVMISGRPYKKAMSKDDVIQELKRYAGRQFDPQLVVKFIELIKD